MKNIGDDEVDQSYELTDAAIEALDQMAAKATPGPWRNLCDEWNAALDARYKRVKKHWHGPLRGTRNKRSNKHCVALIVRDAFQGKPITLGEFWGGYPDWWDLDKIIARPEDDLFHGKRTFALSYDKVWNDKGEGEANADYIAAANPLVVRALIAALRAARSGK